MSNELGFGRLLDFGVIIQRLQQLFEWSAHELRASGFLDCARDGTLTYAWPFDERGVWQPRRSFALRSARHVLPPEQCGRRYGDQPTLMDGLPEKLPALEGHAG